MIPDEYLQDIRLIDIDYEKWRQFAAEGMNYTQWNANQLKIWLEYYVKYHNGVIYFLGN